MTTKKVKTDNPMIKASWKEVIIAFELINRFQYNENSHKKGIIINTQLITTNL